jgi:hypothetical protein
MDTETYISALETELAGYVRRGLTVKADGVRAELARLGRSPGDTPREVVPTESGSTAPKPATRARKPAETPKKPTAPKTPKTRRGGD